MTDFGCQSLCKDTNFKANHNKFLIVDKFYPVSISMQRYEF